MRPASVSLPAPVGPLSISSALERNATRSMRAIILVEGRVARLDAGLQELGAFLFLASEAGTDLVVARQIEINKRVRADSRGVLLARRGRLQRHGWKVTRFGQKKHADLRDVRPRRDVDEISARARGRTLYWRAIRAGQPYDLPEIPGSLGSHRCRVHHLVSGEAVAMSSWS